MNVVHQIWNYKLLAGDLENYSIWSTPLDIGLACKNQLTLVWVCSRAILIVHSVAELVAAASAMGPPYLSQFFFFCLEHDCRFEKSSEYHEYEVSKF